jgi:hypothetical protein
MRLPIRSSPLTVDLRRPQGMPDVTHRWEVRHLVRDSVLPRARSPASTGARYAAARGLLVYVPMYSQPEAPLICSL